MITLSSISKICLQTSKSFNNPIVLMMKQLLKSALTNGLTTMISENQRLHVLSMETQKSLLALIDTLFFSVVVKSSL